MPLCNPNHLQLIFEQHFTRIKPPCGTMSEFISGEAHGDFFLVCRYKFLLNAGLQPCPPRGPAVPLNAAVSAGAGIAAVLVHTWRGRRRWAFLPSRQAGGGVKRWPARLSCAKREARGAFLMPGYGRRRAAAAPASRRERDARPRPRGPVEGGPSRPVPPRLSAAPRRPRGGPRWRSSALGRRCLPPL